MGERTSNIPIAGFEFLPDGQLLTQFVDFDHPMGAAYERCVRYTKDFHTHDRVNLTFPRNTSRIHFTTQAPDLEFIVDDTHFLWMPANVVHRQATVSTLYDNLAIFVADEVVDQAWSDFRLKYATEGELPRETVAHKRTPFLDALVGEYFSERILEKRAAERVSKLTYQIIEEMLRILRLPTNRSETVIQQSESQDLVTVRAVRFIENHLFGRIDSHQIAKAARTSIPTLFRNFRKDTGLTPREYLVTRRMEEAKTLLKRGGHSIGDIALLIGYEDGAAFSKAFKAHSGKSPRRFLDSV